MTRSVEELKRESEHSRLALAATTDRLKEQLSHAADDLQRTVSPQHIKSEVSDYIAVKTRGWLEAATQQAMENPMQAIAAGTAVALPALRIARAFPLPLLMMGAGLALTSKSVRARASSAAAPAIDRAGDVLNQAMHQTRSLAGNVNDGLSAAQDRATGMLGEVRGSADNPADAAGSRVADTARTMSDSVKSGMDAVKDGAAQLREGAQSYAAAAPDKARGVISDNAALICGLGIAIGAVIAAAIPKTEAETKVMERASDSVRQAATDAVQAGLDTVKDTARSAADAAQKSVADADLGSHATRMTQNIADAVKDAAEDVVSAAFNPSHTPEI